VPVRPEWYIPLHRSQITVTYIWVLPAGATIASGAGTNSITVDFALNASSGDITVYGNNLCGNGAASSLPVTVNPVPPAPVITQIGTLLSSNAVNGNQWYFEGTMIFGATNQTYAPTQIGHYWDIVTLNGCSSDTSNHLYVVIIGITDKTSGFGVELYPNPNDGRFALQLSTMGKLIFDMTVVNELGVNVRTIKDVVADGNKEQIFDLGSVPDGVYTIVIRNGDKVITRKFVIKK